jgi:hypothetical protein
MTLPLLLLAALAGSVWVHPLAVSSANTPVVAGDQDGPPTPPPCTADIRWTHDTQLNVSRASARTLTLYTAVSERNYVCLPARIQLTASFFDSTDDLVCSGTVDLAISQTLNVQYAVLELRPGNVYEFVRWRNGPRLSAAQWARLACLTPDGQTEIQPAEVERARSVRLHASILPRQNGLATAELKLNLQP